MGIDACGNTCERALKNNPAIYNNWTSAVVKRIRGTGGNNANRTLILAAPTKTAKQLNLIDPNIYNSDPNMMVEWHIYASGPNRKEGRAKYWVGDGEVHGKDKVDEAIGYGTKFTADTGILTYFGAWMAQTNEPNGLNQSEVIDFSKYFIQALGTVGIPWSLNVLDVYYETKKMRWRTELQPIHDQTLNMSEVLEAITSTMSLYP